MTQDTIAMLMPGDMGHAVGRALGVHDHDVITCLAGRSSETCRLAAEYKRRDSLRPSRAD